MNVKLNKAELRDKILACWIGKNIGGTIGGPYEGGTEMWDITGFKTAKGEPLPNDDLDLQIAWLMTLERVGAKYLDANALAHSWLMYLTPYWNEYGIAMKNLKLGLLPPLSGEYAAINDIQKNYFENNKVSYYSTLCNMSESNFRKLSKNTPESL